MPIRALLVLLLALGLAAAAPASRSASAAKADKAAAKAAAAKAKQARKLVADGDYPAALALLDEGLALDPQNLELLRLRGATLLELRDYTGALAAYEAFLAAGPKGANKRAAEKIVANLQVVKSTFLHVVVPPGPPGAQPAKLYLESKSYGVFCVPGPGDECRRGMLPGRYKITVEREGYAKLVERVDVVEGQVTRFEPALQELPSTLAVTSVPEGAEILVDGLEVGTAPLTVTVGAGEHTLEARLDGHAAGKTAATVHLGQPGETTVELLPILPLRLSVDGAEILVDGKPAVREGAGVVLPARNAAHTITVSRKGFVTRTVEVPAARAAGFVLEVKLEEAPARLSLEGVPAGSEVLVDGVVVGVTPLVKPLELPAGEHDVEIRKPGFAPFRGGATLVADEGSELRMTELRSTRRTKMWISAGVAGAGIAGTVLFGWMALDAEDGYATLMTEPGILAGDPRLADEKQRGERWSLAADVSLGLGLVGAGLATYFYLTENKGLESRGVIEPMVVPGGAGASVGGTF